MTKSQFSVSEKQKRFKTRRIKGDQDNEMEKKNFISHVYFLTRALSSAKYSLLLIRNATCTTVSNVTKLDLVEILNTV